MSLHPSIRFRISNQVLSQEFSGETVLLDLKGECYISLNDVGTRIWQLITANHTVGEVLQKMLAEYEVEQGQLQHDLEDLMGQLMEAGLAEVRMAVEACAAGDPAVRK